jgi:hypothetical protein
MQESVPSSKPYILTMDKRQWTVIFIALGVLIFAVAGWFWYQRIYGNPERVFWTMIENNLATQGSTRTVVQGSADGDSEQVIHLSFGGNTHTRGLTSIRQGGENSSLVRTETIGSHDADYVRYVELKPGGNKPNGQPYDFSAVLEKWGKTPNTEGQQSNILLESLLGLVPVGDFNPAERRELLRMIREKDVYDTDLTKVDVTRVNGRTLYTYKVSVNLQAYLEMMNEYVRMIGIDVGDGLDPTGYAGQSAQAVFSVDKKSRRLATVNYSDGSRTETYGGYGVADTQPFPVESIDLSELQARLQAALAE